MNRHRTNNNRECNNRRIARSARGISSSSSSSLPMQSSSTTTTLLLSLLLLLLAMHPSRLDHPGSASTFAAIVNVDAIEVASLGSSIIGGGWTGGRRRTIMEEEDDYNGGDGEVRDRDDSSIPTCDGVVAESSSSSEFSSVATCHSPGDDVAPDHRGAPHRPAFPVYHRHNRRPSSLYGEYMDGCRGKYDSMVHRGCDSSEYERMDMNARQPPGMINYTTLGYGKVRAPPEMMVQLERFWNGRDATGVMRMPDEIWPPGNSYANHWSSPTRMLDRMSSGLRRLVWDASRDVLESWSSTELSPSSLYGVRVYTNGSILAPHVDRMPLVISAVINVAQDVDEPWPLEVHGHDGRVHNLTMEVGDMILYEGHSVVHGRPYPLKGRYYANLFVHFEPLGHALLHHEERGDEARDDDEESLEQLYQRAWKKLKTKCVDDDECRARVDLNVVANTRVPHYILPGSEEEGRWLQTHTKARLVTTTGDNGFMIRGMTAHTAASSGDLKVLIAIATKDPELIKAKDHNGWTPLHEAVRGGHLECVKFLIKSGLDKDERTHMGVGGTPLWWARKTHGHKHPVSIYLESLGALDISPDGYD
ncbi:hypothetical protein ACHAXA_005636 [Cyclostephanos tholiformis]|uniref:Uncharacterized protein n=1 Tax=Cyclostephanos tholiformis TaxID=382380 RepID=A0ABD3RC39_9STRA